jgi:hypothetical protein
MPSAPLFAPTPIIATIGFPALLPIIRYDDDQNTIAIPGSACIDTEGNVDFQAHPRFILATGGYDDDGAPAWCTTLIHRSRFITPQAISNRQNHLPMPLQGIILGGRNGILILPESNPKTEAELNQLFNQAKKHAQAAAYAEQIRYTPPELRGKFHTRALKRWQEIQTERHRNPDANAPRRPEPSPSVPVAIWKHWLKETRDHPQSGGSFKYIGIPLVGQGYQTAHIEGARALLALLPPTIKGFTLRGPLQDAFLRTAAALLCVPEHYAQLVSQLGEEIAPGHCISYYDEKRFSTASTLNEDSIAKYLASISVSADKAEDWRPWAAAYVEMELEEHPNSYHAQILKQARDKVRERIDNDPIWVFTKIHADAPGNYNLELVKARALRHTTTQPDAGPSPAAAKTSGSHSNPTHPDATGDSETIRLNYGDDQGEDLTMGPA